MATVAARKHAEVFRIPHADFQRTLESDRAIGHIVYRNLLRLLVRRLRQDNQTLDLFRPLPLRRRVGGADT